MTLVDFKVIRAKFFSDIVSFSTQPVQELKEWARVSLEPGQTKTETVKLNRWKSQTLDLHMENFVQPGAFEIMVGGNSNKVINDTLMVPGEKRDVEMQS